MVGPGQVQRHPVGAGPQAVVAVRSGQCPVEAHVGELADRAWREPVAAGLLAGEVLLLDHDHVPAGVGQPVGARRARRAAADDQDVVDTSRRRPPGRTGRGPDCPSDVAGCRVHQCRS